MKRRSYGLKGLRLFFQVIVLVLSSSVSMACDNGADVPDEKCKFFVRFVQDGESVDDRIATRLKVAADEPQIRSLSLIVDINFYPNFAIKSDRKLEPAKNDLKNLIEFFKAQKFEEIIVLENRDASRANIEFFLRDYLVNSARARSGKTRVVFAYSGHGAEGKNGSPGAIVLSEARGGNDAPNTLRLNELAPMLVNIARESYHFLALIGSCYSGGVFPIVDSSFGENYAFPSSRGAHAVSATASDALAYGLGLDKGSIFFDSLIQGVMTGAADPIYAGLISFSDGKMLITGGGIARLGPTTNYISAILDLTKNPSTGESFPQVRMGSLVADRHFGGAFFFLVPKITNANTQPADILNSAKTTGSAVENHPDVKVFNAPDTYQILGADISHFSGKIDWASLGRTGLDFVYMKATEGGDYVDNRFKENWAGSREVGLSRGAYHVVNFCLGADKQFRNIASTVPKTEASLPLVIDLNWYEDGPGSKKQKNCKDLGFISDTLAQLLKLVERHYKKMPVIYAHEIAVKQILSRDPIFSRYPIWLQHWTLDGSPNSAGPKMSGGSPWTIWQFAKDVPYAGAHHLDLNVFFGTKEQFTEFTKGKTNVAFDAASKNILNIKTASVKNANKNLEEAIDDEPLLTAVPIVKSDPQQTTELDPTSIMGSMRWPVKGKIISEYGAKPKGVKNEGINIAVPEGTGIRAAESGVVAYAGKELKGYGNLVLIRHEGGWVTAYAHAKELFVKRGDIVRRGDVIAKAGQTGSVSSPQLHFEVRKGAAAMDPLKFLDISNLER